MLHWNWNKSNLLVGRSDLVRRHGAQSREARMTNDSVSPASISGHDGKEEPEVSRRGFFQQALGGVAVAGAGAFSMVTMSGPVQAQYGGYGGGPNVWKSTAYYRDYPNGPQFCGRCVHFRAPAACQIVEPPISPTGWCRFFYPVPVIYRGRPPVGPGPEY
jgi:hypothetical protein